MTIRLILPGARTKKNSPRILPMVSGEGLIELRKNLAAATSHKDSIRILMRDIGFSVQPSEGYQEWFDVLYLQRCAIQSAVAKGGVTLPILDRISISAQIYREADRGDLLGYEEAIADALQAELWQCSHCRKKTMILAGCPHCKGPIFGMKHSRKGLGIIGDDKQIASWDGSRMHKDSARPRVELEIRVMVAPQQSLFSEKEEEVMV